MSHSEVYKWFELYFPQYAGDKVETWFQNGKNSIRIRQKKPSGIYIYIQQ